MIVQNKNRVRYEPTKRAGPRIKGVADTQMEIVNA